jgi:ABC-type uncharacterized transport system ATPase subunit
MRASALTHCNVAACRKAERELHGPKVHIERLKLTGFRNYASLSLDLDQRHVVLAGDNGAGKPT